MAAFDNAELVRWLRAHFPHLVSPTYAWGRAIPTMKLLPGLRGLWCMSAISNTGAAFDQSNNTRTLTYNGNPTYNRQGAVPYIDFDGTGDFLSRADEAGLDITGTEAYIASALQGLTLGCWVNLDTIAANASLLAKWTTTGNQRSYSLSFDTASGFFQFRVSSNGTAVFTLQHTTTVAVDNWYFVAGRFDPSTTLDIWTNGTKVSAVTVAASVFNSTAQFNIGAQDAGTVSLMNGQVALPFLCAAAVPDALIEMVYHTTRPLFGV